MAKIEEYARSDVDRLLGLADQFLDDWAEDRTPGEQAGRGGRRTVAGMDRATSPPARRAGNATRPQRHCGILRRFPGPNSTVLLQAGSYFAEFSYESRQQDYLTGEAIAVNHRGRVVVLSLDDIYRTAARQFRVPDKEITRAEY